MQARFTEVRWLDTGETISLAQLAELSGFSEEELELLTEYGALPPPDPAVGQPGYRADCLTLARTAARLRKDLELSLEGLSLVMHLLERMHGLEAELVELRAKTPGGRGV